jgi:hypothetical protein
MNTSINNDLRVYQIITNSGKQIFCNIDELNNASANLSTNKGFFKVYHFWNNKAQYLNRKNLDLMFDGSQLKRKFNY